MSENSTIDYKVAFEEVNFLNHMFRDWSNIQPPTLNKAHYERVTASDIGHDTFVYKSLRTGFHYAANRTLESSTLFHYNAFVPVKRFEKIETYWGVVSL